MYFLKRQNTLSTDSLIVTNHGAKVGVLPPFAPPPLPPHHPQPPCVSRCSRTRQQVQGGGAAGDAKKTGAPRITEAPAVGGTYTDCSSWAVCYIINNLIE